MPISSKNNHFEQQLELKEPPTNIHGTIDKEGSGTRKWASEIRIII